MKNKVLDQKELMKRTKAIHSGTNDGLIKRYIAEIEKSHELLRTQLHVWKNYGPDVESATNEYLLEKKVEELRTQVISLKIELEEILGRQLV